MPGKTRSIAESIKILAGAGKQIMNEVGKVVEINEDERTCTVRPNNGNADIQDVNLQANIGLENGIVMFPVVDSDVMVSFLSEENAYISLYSDIDRIMINNGENGGLININDLVGKLNNLENDINDLKQAFSQWTVAPGDGGAALKLIAATWYASLLVPTEVVELEDENVTH